MNVVARVLLSAVVVAAAIRAATTAVHAGLDFPKRTAVYFTEPQMVHLAYRVQHGESLYPDWRTFPHVVNVFTPGYFWIVGRLGRATNASIDGLQRIARGVTVFFALLGAVGVAAAVRRDGKAAMFAAGCLTVGSGVMIGFGWMSRPDVAADVLGFAGFLAATSAAPVLFATALLALGILCKQTAVVYLMAAAVALIWQTRHRRAFGVIVGSGVTTTAVLAIVFLTGERRVIADVLLEATSPWKWDHWASITLRLLSRSGEVVVLCVIGGAGWIAALRLGGSERNATAKRWLALLAVAGIFGGVGSAKFGSDLNYYLPLRYVAAVALAEIVDRLTSPKGALGTIVAAMVTTLTSLFCVLPLVRSLQKHESLNPNRQALVEIYEREIFGVSALGKSKRILTNSDDAAMRMENPFVDSFLFKMLVDSGRLHPTVLEERLKQGKYDMVVATGSLDDPNYRDSAFALPRRLANVITDRYMLVSKSALTYYRPKPESEGSP